MDTKEDCADWSLFFSSGRHFVNIPDSGLRQLIVDLADFPDVLKELYWEVIDRALPDADALLDRIEAALRSARLKQMERELEQLTSFRAAVLVAEQEEPSHAPTPPQPSRDPWYRTAAQIRHAEIDPEKLEKARSLGKGGLPGFQDVSPLIILGYRVGNTSGLGDQERWEFLTDFILEAQLPMALDRVYRAEWCEAKSIGRLDRTIRHINSLISIRERSDPVKYAQAIRDWRLDLHRLQTLRGQCG